MARLFRFVEKKRGQRRTGSNLVGTLGEAIFFGSLFLMGALSLSAVLVHHLVQPDAATFRLGGGGWLSILVTGSFVIIAGGGLIWSVMRVGTSVERRGALARRVANIDLVNAAVPTPRDYPNLPPLDGLTNSPGIQLAYRLPPSQTPGWRLLAVTVFALLWNLVSCLLTVSAIGSHLAGRHEWLLTLLLVPLWAVSTWSVRHLLHLIVLHTGMGQTTVEISDLPLVPGREYQAALSQDGQVTMKSLSLWLVCEEEATFTQGTDIRTEVREVFRQRYYQRGGFRIEPARAFHDTCTIVVPASAMHSFQSAHNAVRWRVVVHGEPEGWPPFDRGFPVVVYPGESTMQVEVGSRVARQARHTAAASAAGVRA
jgi:hypothetical protein